MLPQVAVGSNKMKNFNLISISALALISISCSFGVFAEKSYQQKYADARGEQIPVKCYVEYRGGGDDIQFIVGAFENPNQAKSLLVNRQVVKSKSKSKKTILKVKECVKEEKKFSSSRARNLDKLSPR